MINIIDGDVLKSNEEIIAHQVNCKGKMGSGVALAIRRKWPIVLAMYKSVCENFKPCFLLGQTQLVRVDCDQRVANMFAQNFYGCDGNQYTDLKCFEKCIIDLIDQMNALDIKSVAMPYKIGSCRGGAKWDDVYNILKKYFEDNKIILTLYKLDI